MQDENHLLWGSCDISGDRLEAKCIAKYRQVEDVSVVISKSGIVTRDFVLQVTMSRQSFGEIPNVLMCRKKRILVVVEGHRPFC